MRSRQRNTAGARREPGWWYRRAPTVVSYWKGRRLVFHNYISSVQVTGPPVVADVLHFFHTWRRADALAAVPRAHTLVERLADQTLLDRWDGRGKPPAAATGGWQQWQPAAGLFHFATKDHFDSRQDLEQTEQQILALANETVKAPPVRGPAVGDLTLERPGRRSPLEAIFERRRTWREFGRKPLTRAEVARLLWWVWGVRRWWSHVDATGAAVVAVGGGTTGARRLSGRGPGRGLEAGFYRYQPDRHVLTRLPGRVSPAILPRFLPRQWWFHDAAALFVMSAVFPRIQARYPAPRHYQSVLLEAGHFCQSFCLSATELGLAPFCTQALANRVVEQALGIDGIDESVVYAAGVGHKPARREWRPWPDHQPGHPYRKPTPRRTT